MLGFPSLGSVREVDKNLVNKPPVELAARGLLLSLSRGLSLHRYTTRCSFVVEAVRYRIPVSVTFPGYRARCGGVLGTGLGPVCLSSSPPVRSTFPCGLVNKRPALRRSAAASRPPVPRPAAPGLRFRPLTPQFGLFQRSSSLVFGSLCAGSAARSRDAAPPQESLHPTASSGGPAAGRGGFPL